MAIKPKLAPKKKTTVEDTLGIRVKIIKENKDGSADAQVTFNKSGLETLVQWGIVAMLTAAIDKYKASSGSMVDLLITASRFSFISLAYSGSESLS